VVDTPSPYNNPRSPLIWEVRRIALDLDGQPGGGFSEMALYVLVRRGGDWWLAAGHNTPIVTN